MAKLGTTYKPIASVNTTNDSKAVDPFKPFKFYGSVALSVDMEEHPILPIKNELSFKKYNPRYERAKADHLRLPLSLPAPRVKDKK